MYIHRLNKQNLIDLGNQGYKIIPCDNETKQTQIYHSLKEQGRCARAGLIKNREDKLVLFVLTKENKRKVSR